MPLMYQLTAFDEKRFTWMIVGVADQMHLMETCYDDAKYCKTFSFHNEESEAWIQRRLKHLGILTHKWQQLGSN